MQIYILLHIIVHIMFSKNILYVFKHIDSINKVPAMPGREAVHHPSAFQPLLDPRK